MNSFTINELQSHLVVHLDPAVLAGCDGVEVLAKLGREVKTPHFFLLINKCGDGRWLIAPLFSELRAGSIALKSQYRAGEAFSWLNDNSHVSAYQQWLASDQAIIASLSNDTSTPASRRTYAVNNAEAWDEVVQHTSKNDNLPRSAK